MNAKLPSRWYFDDDILKLEQARVFAPGPQYVGHELMVPNRGDYHTLDWADHGLALVHNDQGVELVTNVCRHRQATMLHGRGNAKAIVCPLHKWSYDLEGKQLGAPHFGEKPCLDLFKDSLTSWNGLLFRGQAPDIPAWGKGSLMDMSRYRFDRSVTNSCDQNWKSFIEVYLDLYHVTPAHPGLGKFVSTEFTWEYGSNYSLQKVGIRDLQNPGTPAWKAYHDQVKAKVPHRPFGALWMLIFPNIMVEWYPGAMMISTVLPQTPQRTLNVVEFYYPPEMDQEFVEIQQAAYLETAVEDEDLGRRMDLGRKTILSRGRDDLGPVHIPMEEGIIQFHDYLIDSIEKACTTGH